MAGRAHFAAVMSGTDRWFSHRTSLLCSFQVAGAVRVSTEMDSASLWLDPPGNLAFGSDDVHVWRAPLDLSRTTVHRLRGALSPQELERASRYRFERDRRRFTVARGLLRLILSAYLGIAAQSVRFRGGPHGKPHLDGDTGQERLRFNVSHSHELGLFAVTRDREVGVDVEFVARDLPVLDVAERFFSPVEVSVLQKLPARAQREAFFTCWTRKEAYIKARGDGLALPLHQFDVSLSPGEPAALLGSEEDPEDVARWSLVELKPGPGYVASLAVEGAACQVGCWQWTDC